MPARTKYKVSISIKQVRSHEIAINPLPASPFFIVRKILLVFKESKLKFKLKTKEIQRGNAGVHLGARLLL